MKGIDIRASDVSGQKTLAVRNVDGDSTIGELVNSLLPSMRLPDNTRYRAHLEREGRALNASESVGDALLEDDHIVLQPDIDAG